MLPQRNHLVIEFDEVFQTNCAHKPVFEFAAARDMILRQPFETVFAPAIDAAVADMHDMGGAFAQDDRRKCAGHLLELGVDTALRMYPAVDGFECARCRCPHAHCFGHRIKGFDEAANGCFRGDASAGVSADAIGDRCDQPTLRERRWRICAGADIILIVRAKPRQAGKTNLHLQASLDFKWHATDPS